MTNRILPWAARSRRSPSLWRFLFAGSAIKELLLGLLVFAAFAAIAALWIPFVRGRLAGATPTAALGSFNYRALAAGIFPLAGAAWLYQWRAAERRLRDASFATKLLELRLTPIPASRVARCVIRGAYLRFAFLAASAMVLGFAVTQAAPPFRAYTSQDFSALPRWAVTPTQYEDAMRFRDPNAQALSNMLEQCLNRALYPALFLLAADCWFGFVLYFQIQRSMGRYFVWPAWSARWIGLSRPLLVFAMPPVFVAALGQSIDSTGRFLSAAGTFNACLLGFLAVMAGAEGLACRRIEWRRD